MIPTLVFDFTAILAPFTVGAGALSILGVVAIAVGVIRVERQRVAAPTSFAPRVEADAFRPAA